MITKDNCANASLTAEHTNTIRIRDYYPDDCLGQEFALVTDEQLAELEQWKRDEESLKKWEKRHRASGLYIDDEDFCALLGAYVTSQEDVVDIRLLFEQALSNCCDNTRKRAELYFYGGLSARKIASLENVNHATVDKSIRYAKSELYKLLKE